MLPLIRGVGGVTLFNGASCSFVTNNANSNGIGRTCIMDLLSNLGGTNCRISNSVRGSCVRCTPGTGTGLPGPGGPLRTFLPNRFVPRVDLTRLGVSTTIGGGSVTVVAVNGSSNRFLSQGVSSDFGLAGRRGGVVSNIYGTFRGTNGGIIIVLGIYNIVRAGD